MRNIVCLRAALGAAAIFALAACGAPTTNNSDGALPDNVQRPDVASSGDGAVPADGDPGVDVVDPGTDVVDPGMDVVGPGMDVIPGDAPTTPTDVVTADRPMMGGDGGMCPAGTADCDRMNSNGCETRLDTVLNCGACGRACTRRNNANASCGAMGCAYACTAGFADCNMRADDGCEVRLDSPTNCGMCGRACSGATPLCSMGMCVGMCPMGSTRCGSACVNTQTSVANCGACNNTCFLPNSVEACMMGRCTVDSCLTGFGNCDMQNATGCETNLNESEENCGRCGNRCTGGANGRGSCIAGSCGLVCNFGFANCDGNAANGCEVRLDSAMHCGRCGNVCPMGQRCLVGMCR